MAADRRVDAADGIGQFAEQRLIERLTHAVQALKFVALDTAGILDDAGDGERIVGGKLRKDALARGKELPRTSHVTKIGHGLAGKYRIVGQAALLRALDLGVPIGALDQPDRQPVAERGSRLFGPVDNRQGTLLIGLHGKTEAFEAAQRRICRALRR